MVNIENRIFKFCSNISQSSLHLLFTNALGIGMNPPFPVGQLRNYFLLIVTFNPVQLLFLSFLLQICFLQNVLPNPEGQNQLMANTYFFRVHLKKSEKYGFIKFLLDRIFLSFLYVKIFITKKKECLLEFSLIFDPNFNRMQEMSSF